MTSNIRFLPNASKAHADNLAIHGTRDGSTQGGFANTRGAYEAKYWAFILDGYRYESEVVLIVKTSRLKKLLEKKKFPMVRGGDDNTSKMYLVNPKYLLEV